MTFAHILHNSGFHDPAALADRVAAWRAVFDAERPDLILCEHSPTALVAARGFPTIRVVIGTGFTCPPALAPLPCLRRWVQHDPEELARDEQIVLGTVNHVLHADGQPPAPTLARLFMDADALVLRTLPELDHYPARPGCRYAGVWANDRGNDLGWLTDRRPRVFAYLKPTAGIGEVLAAVGRVGGEVVAHVPGLAAADATTARAAGVRLLDQPADIRIAGGECDLAVLNGTHGTTVGVLLAGKPVVQVPIYLEQVLVALRTVALGAGRIASRADPQAVAEAVREVYANPLYRAAARRFARRYERFDPRAAVRSLADRLETLGSG
jgi:UDP:flavonoid glycosyltransferase YjiC (YdhE family)